MPVSYLSPKTRIRKSAIHGRGLFASGPIRKGEIVAIKGGHILDRRTLSRVRRRIAASYMQIDDLFYIGALRSAEVALNKIFINHSCEPNTGFAGNIVLVAMRDISPGEELTTDYALFDDYDGSMDCRCGTASCRGTVSGLDWQRPELQRKYGPYFSWYLQRRRAAGPAS
jgi:SET domain-containing protein